jgi:hypothetical protein
LGAGEPVRLGRPWRGWSLAALLLLLRGAEAPSWRRWAPAGAALGALFLQRSEAVVLVPAAADLRRLRRR